MIGPLDVSSPLCEKIRYALSLAGTRPIPTSARHGVVYPGGYAISSHGNEGIRVREESLATAMSCGSIRRHNRWASSGSRAR